MRLELNLNYEEKSKIYEWKHSLPLNKENLSILLLKMVNSQTMDINYIIM